MSLHDIYSVLVEKLTAWLQSFVSALPNLVVALVVLLLSWFVAKGAHRVSSRALETVNSNRAARGLLAAFVRVSVMVAGLVIALGVLNLDKALASILAGAGVLGLALGFAFQDLAANIISGVGLTVNRTLPFKIGDVIQTNDTFGTVKDITLRTSILETVEGTTVIIPNRQVFQEKVINYTVNHRLRVSVSCGVSYGEDLDAVRTVVADAMDKLQCRDRDHSPLVVFEAFGDSSINFRTVFWIPYENPRDLLVAQDEALRAIKRAFDDHDIMIPFPIRTLDFGIRGGAPLGEVLAPALDLARRQRTLPSPDEASS